RPGCHAPSASEAESLLFTIQGRVPDDAPAGTFSFQGVSGAGPFELVTEFVVSNGTAFFPAWPDVHSTQMTVVSPGEVLFQRGDANGDGAIDISDPLFVLSVLFLGGEANCSDALDVDDSGSANISDAIGLLLWLFNRSDLNVDLNLDCHTDSTVDALEACRRASCAS
ncbi:MAG: hypothetical protein AAF517_09980, partial [Planctomycetota bacterium]